MEETRALINCPLNNIQLGKRVAIDSQVFSRHTPEEMSQERAFKLIGLVDQKPQRMFLHPETRLVKYLLKTPIFILFGNRKILNRNCPDTFLFFLVESGKPGETSHFI